MCWRCARVAQCVCVCLRYKKQTHSEMMKQVGVADITASKLSKPRFVTQKKKEKEQKKAEAEASAKSVKAAQLWHKARGVLFVSMVRCSRRRHGVVGK